MTLSVCGVVGDDSMQYPGINGSHHWRITVVPLTVTMA
jgi:hypothetical protein